MTTLNLQFGFNVPRKVIYDALIHPMTIMQYTRAKAAVEPKQGGEYNILDGRIQGRFVSLRQGQYIKMQWKFNDWKEYSIVEIMLRDEDEDECDIYLTQSGIPANQKKQKLQFGWKQYYFGAMNKILGYPLKQ